MVEHLDHHPHAFLDENNVVGQIAAFDGESHDDAFIQSFAGAIGFVKAVCCCTFGLPYIGDSWDEINKTWIEDPILRAGIPEIETTE